MIYVYAIVGDPDLELGPRLGLGGAPLEVVAVPSIAAIASFHDRPLRQPARLDDLQQHHSVVEAAMATGTVVPTRFGTSFPDVNALEQVLRARQEQLTRLLALLTGKVELAVRARVSSESGPHGDAPDNLLDELCGSLATNAVATVVNRRGPGTIAAAFLVCEDELPSFQRSTAEIMGRHTAVRASLTGPWPPYSFTDPAALSDQMTRPALAASVSTGATHG